MTLTTQAAAGTIPIGQAAPISTGTAPAAQAVQHPQLNVTQRKSLPTGVSSNCKQHVGMCCDVSTSMGGSKISDLNKGRHALCMVLADPVNKDGFELSVVDFNNRATLVVSGEPATSCQMPTSTASGGTNFDAPINAMVQEIEDLKARPNPDGWRYLRPHVLFLSDGQAHVTQSNIDALHELADVTAIAYGDDADQATLARIASDGNVHVVGTDGNALRDFLAEVGKTMTQDRLQAI